MNADPRTDPAEQRVLDALDRLGIPYEAVRIDPAFAATADFCREYGYTMEGSVNCIVVMGKVEPPVYAACMVQATRRLDVNGTQPRLTRSRRWTEASCGSRRARNPLLAPRPA